MSSERFDGRARYGVLPLLLAAVLAAGAGGCGDADPGRPSTGSRPADADRTDGAGASPARTHRAGPRVRPTSRARGGVAWTHATVLRRVAGRVISVEGRSLRIDGATVTCGGVGAPATRRAGAPAWRLFRCVQPTFPAGEIAGPDAIFLVRPTGRRAFAVSRQRFTRY